MKAEEENPEELQKTAVFNHLTGGADPLAARSLTALEALEIYGIFRLSHIIWLLRKEGHTIETELIPHKTKKRCKYARYTFKPKPLI